MNGPLIRRLRDAGGRFVPYDALRDGDGLDALQRDLAELEAFGFVLERHPYQGVAWRGPSDRLCPDQIESGLAARRVGRRVAVWDRVSSTNDLASAAASSTANEGLVVLAESQTAGRGRRGRVWVAPPRSGILMSVLLFPEGPLAEPSWLTALGAVVVTDLVRADLGLDAAIKWPNDVRVGGRKVAGILVERGTGAVVGIGLNVNAPAESFPDELRASATSLGALTGQTLDRSEIARGLIAGLDARYETARATGPGDVRRAWRERSEHLGRPVRVATNGGVVSGLLTGLDLHDGLTVRGPDGRDRRVPAAEVVSVRDEGESAPPSP